MLWTHKQMLCSGIREKCFGMHEKHVGILERILESLKTCFGIHEQDVVECIIGCEAFEHALEPLKKWNPQ